MNSQQIGDIRFFNRFYTNIIGLLNGHILNSKYSLPEVRILFELHHHPNQPASDIAAYLGIDKGYLSKILKNFEKQGLIRRIVSGKDKRSSNLELTEEGKAEFQLLNEASSQQIREIFGHCTPDELNKVIKKMNEIQNILNKRIL